MGVRKNLRIFVVEDNKIYNKIISEFIHKQGFTNLKSFHSGLECLKAVQEGDKPDIVIQDYQLQDTTGMEVLSGVKKYNKRAEFVFLTSTEDIEIAVKSLKLGAHDYIIKGEDLSVKDVHIKLVRLSKQIEINRKNLIIKRAIIISVSVLAAIIAFTALHTVFDAFGLQR